MTTMHDLKQMWLMPFRAIAAAFRMASRNRDRIRDFLHQPRVATTLKSAMLLTLLLWLAIAFFTRGTSDDRLSDAFKNLWSQPADQPSKDNPGGE